MKKAKIGIGQRIERLKIIVASIKAKEKEERRLNTSCDSKKITILQQRDKIAKNQQKSNSLDNELNTKIKYVDKELKVLDKFFIDKKVLLDSEINVLIKEKDELQGGINSLNLNIEKTKTESRISKLDMKKSKKDLTFFNIKLKALVKLINNNKNMAKKSKTEKEIALKDLADYP